MGFLTARRPRPSVLPGKAEALWPAHAGPTDYPLLVGETSVDVAIVGAGVVGLTAAHLLADAGKSVAVVEAGRVGRQATARSTAKVTSQHGLIYQGLVEQFGIAVARQYADANQSALERVAAFVDALAIPCGFERKAAYLYAVSRHGADKIRSEVNVTRELGLPAQLVRELPAPVAVKAAIRFDHQAQFDPSRYLIALARGLEGSTIFEQSRVSEIEHGEPCRVRTERGNIRARHVIIATHLPIIGAGAFFAKVQPCAHPMLAAPIGKPFDGMFLSVDESPGHSFRTAGVSGVPYVVAVGGAHRPGDAEAAAGAFADLEQFVRTQLGAPAIAYRWTNEDYNSSDGVPFVGRADNDHPHFLVATGFGAWGITNGTAAAMILCDLILGRANRWATAFDATRTVATRLRPGAVKETAHMVGALLGSYLKPRPRGLEQLENGEADVFTVSGEKTAIYRDEAGKLHMVSATCTHMGCTVGWNPVDRTWDCACHGSRFDVGGAVLHAPAVKPLAAKHPGRT